MTMSVDGHQMIGAIELIELADKRAPLASLARRSPRRATAD